jgi:D-alanine-D-alanine ligase
MRVLILHQDVAEGDLAQDLDVLRQVAAISTALEGLGHAVVVAACTLDLATLDRTLERVAPDLVFNLVESLGGSDRLIHVVPALLEARRVPFTGSSSSVLVRSTDKVHSKEELRAAGIQSPPTVSIWPGRISDRVPEGQSWIVKSTWEHGSRGLADQAVLAAGADVHAAMEELADDLGGECFAEPYIEGRELNLSLLETPAGVEVLPPAEIEFVGFPDDKPRIVGHAAKWDDASFESTHTPRRFAFPREDRPLLDRLSGIALACWTCLGLRGWARVDFRVDEHGEPWVLEVNANPCLAPDAGFAAALDRAGTPFGQAIEWLAAVPFREAERSQAGEPATSTHQRRAG